MLRNPRARPWMNTCSAPPQNPKAKSQRTEPMMILTKFQVATVAIGGCAIAAGAVWEIRENSTLRSTIVQAKASARATTTALEKQLAAQSERSTTAEARVAALLK